VVEDLGEVVPEGLGDALGHGLGQDRLHGGLGQRPEAAGYGGHLRDVLALEHAVPEVGSEHMTGHGAGQLARGGVHVGAEPAGHVQHCAQWHPRRNQLGARVQQPRAWYPVSAAVGLDQAERDCLRDVFRGDLTAEHFGQPDRGHVGGHLVGPRHADGGFEVQDLGDVAAALPDGQQLADVGEGVPALEQLADQPQPRQVGIGVDADAAVAAGRGEQAAILVHADVADRCPRQPRQLVNPVLAHGVNLT
jgi:hypothetical protein